MVFHKKPNSTNCFGAIIVKRLQLVKKTFFLNCEIHQRPIFSTKIRIRGFAVCHPRYLHALHHEELRDLQALTTLYFTIFIWSTVVDNGVIFFVMFT